MSILSLTTTEILDLFTEEVNSRSGSVSSTFNDGRRLFARSTLPQVAEIRPGDSVQGGVAVKATSREICLYPYLFRQVCSNGAIMAQKLESRRIDLAEVSTPQEGEELIREALAACCQPEVFAQNVAGVRSIADCEIDMALMMVDYLARLPRRFFSEILEHFFADEDRTAYGAMNAITAVARETREPEQRWQLEELGGGVVAWLKPRRPVDSRGIGVEGCEPVTIS